MRRSSLVQGIWFKKLKVWTTWDSICSRSAASRLPFGIDVRLAGDVAQLTKLPFFEQRGLIGFDNKLEIVFQTIHPLVEILTQSRNFGQCIPSITFEEHLQLTPRHARF